MNLRELRLVEQPFDDLLLDRSKLYRQSRVLFLENGGKFRPRMLSSARTLGSPSLVTPEIEYSPVGTELNWSLTDRLQKKDHAHLAQVQSWITGVYHEQNHRNLWKFLRRTRRFCPAQRDGAYRYLNLAESLVIILDMALGDELDARTANHLYFSRGIYNGGSAAMRKLKLGSPRYREAMLTCLTATYLRLEGLHPEDIPGFCRQIFAHCPGSNVDAAIRRALKIEPLFVELTNPIWQKKHVTKVMAAFAPPRRQPGLMLPRRSPLNNAVIESIGTEWLALHGL